MKLDKIQALSIAALLAAAVVALPLASSPASAQLTPVPSDSFAFGDTLTSDLNATDISSFLVMSGISAVEGTEVTGVVMNGDEEVSVTLINANETGESDAVEVIVFTGTMDVMSILSSGELTPFMDDDGFSNSTAAEDDDSSGLDDTGRDSLSEFDDFVAEDFRGGNDTAFAHSMDPMELFGNMKNGSVIVPQGWNSPHNVNVTLVGNATGPAPAAEPDTTFVFVMVVPYTETEQTDLEG